ncbi:unnamed protein product [Ambrosiozyma monospora]|uniref:Unnamed protein product n=1 Tax=Ambrosiozyma monospora TaxID=43982 RepID=A0ACB5SU64_AMBMO|nr:unnamed protein product [Ambrosiozyma monospora]
MANPRFITDQLKHLVEHQARISKIEGYDASFSFVTEQTADDLDELKLSQRTKGLEAGEKVEPHSRAITDYNFFIESTSLQDLKKEDFTKVVGDPSKAVIVRFNRDVSIKTHEKYINKTHRAGDMFIIPGKSLSNTNPCHDKYYRICDAIYLYLTTNMNLLDIAAKMKTSKDTIRGYFTASFVYLLNPEKTLILTVVSGYRHQRKLPDIKVSTNYFWAFVRRTSELFELSTITQLESARRGIYTSDDLKDYFKKLRDLIALVEDGFIFNIDETATRIDLKGYRKLAAIPKETKSNSQNSAGSTRQTAGKLVNLEI